MFDYLFLEGYVKTKLLLLFLILMFIDYAGYGYYVFYLSFFYVLFHDGFKLIDKIFLFLFIWGGIYGLTNYINSGFTYPSVLLPMMNCPFLYLLGKYIAKYNGVKSLPFLLFLFSVSIAFIAILSIFKDISINGYFVLGLEGRNIPLLGLNNEIETTAATGISSRLILLSSFVFFIMYPYERRSKFFILFSSLISIYCVVRIQSRTVLVCLALSFIISVLWGGKTLSNKQKMILFLISLLMIISIFYILENYSQEIAIIDRFQSEEIESGGGRTYRLLEVAKNIPVYPFGNMIESIPYAHNLWFDCARVAGITPFVLLIAIYFVYIVYLIDVIKNTSINLTFRFTVLILSISILFVFLAEPVLEGIPVVFEFFCFLFGVIANFYNIKTVKL